MESDNFFLTLPSNSSMKFYPENTMANFTTRLPQELRLIGKWAIGLSDIYLPSKIGLPKFQFKLKAIAFGSSNRDADTQTYTTEAKFFPSSNDLISHLNSIYKMKPIQSEGVFKFYLNSINKVDITIPQNYVLEMDYELQYILGFREESKFIQTNSEPYDQVIRAVTEPIMTQLYTLFIYTNICEHQIVGDSLVPLLDIISVTNNSKITQHYRFEKPRYVNLNNKNITDIAIHIMDDKGRVS